MTEDELVRAEDGDLKSIEQICIETWEPLYRFVYYKVQNREEAEDITQETYIKSLMYLKKQGDPRYNNFLGFIKTIALNIIRDRWRQKKRQGPTLNFEDGFPLEIVASSHQEEIIQRIQVEEALAKLNKEHRSIIELRIIKGYSVAETAKLVGKTDAAVRTSQYRALQALARILNGNDSNKEG